MQLLTLLDIWEAGCHTQNIVTLKNHEGQLKNKNVNHIDSYLPKKCPNV